MAKFCPNCGAPCIGSPKFCTACGAALTDAAPAPQSPPMPGDTPAAPQGQANPLPGPDPSQGATAGQPPRGDAPQEASNSLMTRPQPESPQTVYQDAPPFGQPSGPGMPPPGYGPGATGYPGGGERYVPDEGLVAMFLRHDNRLNRKAYIMRSLALIAAIFVIAMLLGFLSAMLKSPAIRKMSVWISLVFVIPDFMLVIRRLHDLNRSAWWIIIKFIPGLNLLLSCYLLFFKGTEGPNRYGPDPLEGQS